MNEKLIEQIVERVLHYLNKQVLVVLSSSEGYQKAIYQRLTQFSSVSFSLYATASMPRNDYFSQWATLGKIVDENTFLFHELGKYHCIFLPFIDSKTVGEIANGLFTSEESRLVLRALSLNIPVMALKYHCHPDSELNHILGLNKNEKYNSLIKDNISKAISLGIQFDSLNKIENKLTNNKLNEEKNYKEENDNNQHHYITLKEVMNNPGGYCTNKNKLTDSAIDYLKSLKK